MLPKPVGGPACLYMRVKSGYRRAPGRLGGLVAWRIFAGQNQAEIVASVISGLGTYQRVDLPIHCVPDRAPPPIAFIRPLTAAQLMRKAQFGGYGKQRGIRRKLKRKLEEIIREQPELAKKLIKRYYARGSPLHALGVDRPDDWTEDENEGAPFAADATARILQVTPWLLLNHRRFSVEEHLAAALAYAFGVDWACRAGADRLLDRHGELALGLGTVVRWDHTLNNHRTLERFGLDPRENYFLPWRHKPGMETAGNVARLGYPDLEAACHDFLRWLPNDARGAMITDLYHTAFERLLTTLNGGTPLVDYQWSPELKAVWTLVELGALPPPGTPAPILLGLIHSLMQHQAARADRLPSRDDVVAMARSLGITGPLTRVPNPS